MKTAVDTPAARAAARSDPYNRVLLRGLKRAEELEPRLARILEPILRKAGEKAAAAFEAKATDHLTAASWSAPAPDEILDVDALVAELRTKTDPVRLAVVESVMTPTLESAGLSFDVTNPLTRKVLAQSGSQVKNIAETTQVNVMRAVRVAYDEGLSIPDTAKAIRTGMADASVARSTLIARTEIVGAVNGGSLAATQIVSEVTGQDFFKQWLTAPGAPFPRHELEDGLDGQTVRMDDYFQVGGDQLQFPGDPDGSPEEVCNCRCTMVYTEDAGELSDGSGGTSGGIDGGGDGGGISADEGGGGGDGGGFFPAAPARSEGVATDAIPLTPIPPLPADAAPAADLKIPKGLTVSEDPYVASLEVDKYQAGRKINHLTWKERNQPDKFSDDDAAKLRALRRHQGNLQDFLIAPSIDRELALIDRELLEGRSFTDPESRQYAKLLEARKKQILDLRAAPETTAPPPATGSLKADLTAIHAKAEWISSTEAARKAAEITRSGVHERYYPDLASNTVAPYLREQMDAVLEAGARLDQELTVDPRLEQDYKAAVMRQETVGTTTPELEVAAQAWRDSTSALHEVAGQEREEVALRRYGKSFDELEFQQQRALLADLPNASPRYAAAVEKRAQADRDLKAARDAFYAIKADAARAVKETGNAMMVARREALSTALSSVRDVGSIGEHRIRFFEGHKNPAGYKKARALLTAAEKFFPTDWLSRGRPIEAGTSKRGHHTSYGVRAEIKISPTTRGLVQADDEGLSTAIHEYGHEVEETVPFVRDLEKAFYELRTRGGTLDGPQEPLQRLSVLRRGWGYGAKEVTREDKFADPYMGKDYGGRNYEILTMGLEAVWSGSYEIDAEVRRFILGLLAIV